MNAHPDLHASTQSAAIPRPGLTCGAAHLTASQIDDHLIGDLAPAPAAHLAACTLCAQRVAEAFSPIASFDAVATAWSERRSATLPIPVPSQPRPAWQRHSAWATASLALALGLALVNTSHRLSLDTTAPASAAFSQTAPSAAAASVPAAAQAPTLSETPSLAPRADDVSASQVAATHVAATQVAATQPAALQAPDRQPAAVQAPAPDTSVAQLSADNHLLRTVNAAFDPSSDSAAALGLAPGIAASAQAPASMQD